MRKGRIKKCAGINCMCMTFGIFWLCRFHTWPNQFAFKFRQQTVINRGTNNSTVHVHSLKEHHNHACVQSTVYEPSQPTLCPHKHVCTFKTSTTAWWGLQKVITDCWNLNWNIHVIYKCERFWKQAWQIMFLRKLRWFCHCWKMYANNSSKSTYK